MYYAYFHKGWSMSFHMGSDLLGKNKINVHEIIKWVSSNPLTMDMWGIDFVPAAHWDFVLAAFRQGFSQTLAHKKLHPNCNMKFTDRFIRCARPRYHGNRSQCVWVAVALASMYLIQTLSWERQPKEYCRISAINRMLRCHGQCQVPWVTKCPFTQQNYPWTVPIQTPDLLLDDNK